jgi:hypothetical protein
VGVVVIRVSFIIGFDLFAVLKKQGRLSPQRPTKNGCRGRKIYFVFQTPKINIKNPPISHTHYASEHSGMVAL